MDVDLAAVARLLGDPTRAAMLDGLLAGRPLAAGELARLAGVSRATASEHLARLTAGGLVDVAVQGRHRYYRLASADVAHALEALARVSPPREVRSLRQSQAAASLGFARTCYDHLAGVAGVVLHDALAARGWLLIGGEGYELTPAGTAALTEFGVDIERARRARRGFARPCLDWTERRSHLAGSLGAALTAHLLDIGWFTRRRTGERGLRLTPAGEHGLVEVFGCAGLTRPVAS